MIEQYLEIETVKQDDGFLRAKKNIDNDNFLRNLS